MSKQQLEQFRVKQFAAPHPAKLHTPSPQQMRSSTEEPPDDDRVIIHFDVRQAAVASHINASGLGRSVHSMHHAFG